MYWKHFKNLPAEQKRDEAYYIIGLDIGNDSSGIAFYNATERLPEAIDLSGGYGKPTVPTVMQYIEDTKEWVYGEYAILNRGLGTEITLTDLVRRLGNADYIEIARKPVSVVAILGAYIRELLGSVKNINPKAEIVGIVAAVPTYFSDQARTELSRAFKAAGYERELIALVSDRECALARHYANHAREQYQEERVLLLDYGSREVRGGLYHIKPEIKMSNAAALHVKCISSLFDDTIGTFGIVSDVCDMFEGFLSAKQDGKALTPQLREQIAAFVYQNKDMLFQKNIRAKPIKIYFNFAYPPFEQTLSNDDAARLVKPYSARFSRFIRDMLSLGENVMPADISSVVCAGGGFEMLWAREAVNELFSSARTRFHKNAKLIIAEGAAMVASALLDVSDAPAIVIEDRHQLTVDIGLREGANFLPLVERNAFWWQKFPDKLILVNREVGTPHGEADGTLRLQLTARNADGELTPLGTLELPGLPPRPKGTTRLGIGLNFSSDEDATINIRDAGFGEIYPRTDYHEAFEVKF